MQFTHPRRARALLIVLATLIATVAAVSPATAAVVAPQLLSPKAGAVLPVGTQATFKIKDLGQPYRGNVWIGVSSTKKKDRYGRLKDTSPNGTYSAMKPGRHRRWSFLTPSYVFPDWFMNRPGKYYWQAGHIQCGNNGCYVVSKVRSFVVQ